MTTTTFTIDCETCPARGRLCGDCFVPVLGRTWLDGPAGRNLQQPRQESPSAGLTSAQLDDPVRPGADFAPLDTDELAAVSAFVRAGLVSPDEAVGAQAELTGGARSAVG